MFTGECFSLNSGLRNILCSQKMDLVLIDFFVYQRNLYLNFIDVLQGLDRSVTGVLHGCYMGFIGILQGCYVVVTGVLHMVFARG